MPEMTLAEKIATLDAYGFRFSLRVIFDRSPQARRENFATTSGQFAVWEINSDVDGWAVVGDNPDELADLTLDTIVERELFPA